MAKIPGRMAGLNMLRGLQDLQARIEAEQEQLANQSVTVSVGGGAVTAVMTGQQKLLEVHIEPELLAPEQAELLAELIIAAVNQALEQSQRLAAERMASVTRELGLPGIGA